MDLFRVQTISSILDTRMALESLLENNTTFYLSLFCPIIAIFVFILTTRRRRRNKSNLPPSPPKLPLIGNLHQLGTLPHRTFRHLSHKYGPLMLLHFGQTPTLVVSSADIVREIVKTHDIVFSNRPQSVAAKIFFYRCKDLAFNRYGDDWRQKRKICVLELLSLNRVRSFQFIREEEVTEMVSKIREACEKNNNGSSPIINLTQMLVEASNNIASRCVLGQKYDVSNGRSSFEDIARKVLVLFVAVSFGDFIPSLWWMDYLTGLIPKLKATFREFDAFFDEVIAQHKTAKRNGDDDKKDFVDILLQLQEEATPEFGLTQEDIKAIIMNIFVAGSDTSSATQEWAMAELMRNPSIMKKAQEEVRRVVGDKSKVEEIDVKQMKYLECVVKETLRLHPPAALLVPRETSSGVKLRGYDIPPKTTVLINAWAIQRDPEFWERAEEFVPERFENSEIDFKGQDFEFIPFGAGRKGCPGISFGVTSVLYALANVLYWFDWKLPGTATSAQDIDMTETYGITTIKKEPLRLQPVPVQYSFGSKV